jgi:hypothetical protein
LAFVLSTLLSFGVDSTQIIGVRLRTKEICVRRSLIEALDANERREGAAARAYMSRRSRPTPCDVMQLAGQRNPLLRQDVLVCVIREPDDELDRIPGNASRQDFPQFVEHLGR